MSCYEWLWKANSPAKPTQHCGALQQDFEWSEGRVVIVGYQTTSRSTNWSLTEPTTGANRGSNPVYAQMLKETFSHLAVFFPDCERLIISATASPFADTTRHTPAISSGQSRPRKRWQKQPGTLASPVEVHPVEPPTFVGSGHKPPHQLKRNWLLAVQFRMLEAGEIPGKPARAQGLVVNDRGIEVR